tara:strand:- start:290 stop:2479 length:2190 start_codon:yes stop_codon:yes gene_type:complete
MSNSASDPWVSIVDDDDTANAAAESGPWRILVVDDEPDVHQATLFALRDVKIFGRPLELLHAESKADAIKMIDDLQNVAAAFIDVVMEMPDSGLELVQAFRQAGLANMRIILRTGHPGYAPEQSVINEYEIDDYRTKGELTRSRLLTVLTAAIRSYDQLCTIDQNRAGLELIVESASKVFQRTNLELFSRGVLTQIAGLLGMAAHGLVYAYPTGNGKGRHIVSAVGRFADLIGRQREEIEDPDVQKIIDTAPVLGNPVIRDGYMTLHFTSADGHGLIVVLEAGREITGPNLALLKLFSTNITIGFENLNLVEKLDELAYLDPFLNVPNLNAFEQKLRDHFSSPKGRASVAIANIDSYQSIVATYGFTLAHKYLFDIYEELKSSRTYVARVGDGIFAVLGQSDDLDETALLEALTRLRLIDGIEITTSATTAILDLADIEPDPAEVLKTAKSALQHVRQTARGKVLRYDRRMRAETDRRDRLQAELRRVAGTGEGLSVHLQPKVVLLTGEAKGAEALLRWTLEGEPISPAEFIPIAESIGLVEPLTGFVVHEVGKWSKGRQSDIPVPVAVNLSMADLNRPEFSSRLLREVSAAGLGPDAVEFEVTEGIAMRKGVWAQAQIRALADAGFRISLDDFGTGYSSLSQFDRLPIDMIKIDRSFVSALKPSTARESLASVVLGMTQVLDVDCVAEGIETEEQKQALIFLGCTTGQGYLLGYPTPIEDFDGAFVSK